MVWFLCFMDMGIWLLMETDIILQEMTEVGSVCKYRQFIVPADASLDIKLQERRPYVRN